MQRQSDREKDKFTYQTGHQTSKQTNQELMKKPSRATDCQPGVETERHSNPEMIHRKLPLPQRASELGSA